MFLFDNEQRVKDAVDSGDLSAFDVAIAGLEEVRDLGIITGGMSGRSLPEHAFRTGKPDLGLRLLREVGVVEVGAIERCLFWLACSPTHAGYLDDVLDEAARIGVDAGGLTQHDRDDRSLLHCAVETGKNPEALAVLLSKGVDPNLQDMKGRTALHLVASSGAGPGWVSLLVDAGASLRIRDCRGMTPVMAAIAQDRDDLLRVMHERGAELHFSCANPDARGREVVRGALGLAMATNAHKCGGYLVHSCVDDRRVPYWKREEIKSLLCRVFSVGLAELEGLVGPDRMLSTILSYRRRGQASASFFASVACAWLSHQSDERVFRSVRNRAQLQLACEIFSVTPYQALNHLEGKGLRRVAMECA